MPVNCGALIDDAKEKLRRLGASGAGLAEDIRRYKGRDEIAIRKDAAENRAMLDARSRSNGVNRELNRGFGIRNEDLRDDLKREALTFATEAGTRERLASDRAKIAASTKADPALKARAIKAIDYADRNWARIQEASRKYGEEMAGQHRAENASGIPTPFRERYVPHAQDLSGVDPTIPFERGGKGGGAGFKKARSYESYADSIADGLKPKTLDAIDLLQDRIHRGQRLIENQAWAEAGRHIIDDATGMPLVTDYEKRTITRPDGSTVVQETVPRGYAAIQVGNRMMPVLKGYVGLYKSLTSESAFDNSTFGRALMKSVGGAKHVVLGFDTFHPFRVAAWNLGLRGSTSFKKGGWLLDQTMPEIERDIRKAGLPPAEEKAAIDKAREQKVNLSKMVDRGLNVGSIVDNIHKEISFALPVVGKALKGYNKLIFDSFQRGAMAESALYEYDKIRQANPTMSSDAAATAAAKAINTRFGNLGNQSWIKSKTLRDLSRLAFLAPQWNEGLLRSELGAYKDIAKLPVTGKLGTLGRTVGVMVVGQLIANQAINLTTRGHFTWQNPEEGIDSKLAAWLPDKIGHGHGLFLDPFSLPAEITGDVMREAFKKGSLKGAVSQILDNKLSPVARALKTYALDKQPLGAPINSAGDMAKALGAVFLPIQSSSVAEAAKSIAGGQVKEPYQGATEKGLLSNVGVRTQLAPSYVQRLQHLASEYKREHNIPVNPEYNPSDYRPFFRALERGDADDAKVELDHLKAKHDATQISRYLRSYDHHPFVGAKEKEVEFINTLSDEQKQAYVKALEERRDLKQKAIRFILEGKI